MLSLILTLLLAVPTSGAYDIPRDFFNCLSWRIYPSTQILSAFYTPRNSSFEAVLKSTAQNLRFVEDDVPKPVLILTPLNQGHVQAAVSCARWNRLHMRIRSGGHDYEGLSYVSRFGRPFIVLDLQMLRAVLVNPDDQTAWVDVGATNGELYRRISLHSDTLGFPAGIYDSLGMGGHISGGAYGAMMRKHGLGVDNVLDVLMVNAQGLVLDRRAMGEDLFWAIRGGAGGSFGVILSWKLRLVPVPKIVTVFTVARTVDRGATDLVMKWQEVSYQLDERLFIRLITAPSRTEKPKSTTVVVLFNALFLGGKDALLDVMRHSFPELGLTQNDCKEMSWINSVVYMGGYDSGTSPDSLLLGKAAFQNKFKSKSDFLQKPVGKDVILKLWEFLKQEDSPLIIMNPFGGAVNRIAKDATAFPHRDSINMIQYVTMWQGPDPTNKHPKWVRDVHKFMTPFVNNSPRAAYVNYRDLDLGMNENGWASYWQVKYSYGSNYFKNNFKRLARVKAKVDPENFFNHEQSIPPLYY